MHKKQYNLGFPYEVTLNILVDRDANFLELTGNNCDVIEDLIRDCIYDLDDVTITSCEVIQRAD